MVSLVHQINDPAGHKNQEEKVYETKSYFSCTCSNNGSNPDDGMWQHRDKHGWKRQHFQV